MEKLNTADSVFLNYKVILTGKIYKILPLIEKKNETVEKYLDSFLFELYGLKESVNKLENNGQFVTLVSTIEKVYLDVRNIGLCDVDVAMIKREIFKCLRLVDKIR